LQLMKTGLILFFGLLFLGVNNLEAENHFLDVRVGVAAKGVTQGTNVVYQGVNAAGKVKYVGITSRNPALRFGEHLNSIGTGKELLNYRVIDGATNLTRTQARVWEQGLINQYGLGKNGGQLLNRINSIAPKHWWQYGIK